MNNINFAKYFNESVEKYYNPKILLTILEDILGKSFSEIKKDINENQIIVTKEQIENYLEQKFIEEDPELKKRIENPRPKRSKNIAKWTKQDIEDSSQEFVDNLSAGRYYFEPYTLEYFKRYSAIVRDKALLLVSIIEKIGNKESLSIQDLLTELDIQLDANGNILHNDIIRLIKPTIENIIDLNEITHKANDLSTYLTFKMSKHSLLRDDISKNEIYPSKSLQIKNLYYNSRKGNVPLSINQKTALEEEQSRNSKKLAKILLDL